MKTKEKHMNIPRSIIHEPKTSDCGSAGVRDCGTAGALVVYQCNISFFFFSTAGVREHQFYTHSIIYRDCGTTGAGD